MRHFRLTLYFPEPPASAEATDRLIRRVARGVRPEEPDAITVTCVAILEPNKTRIDVEFREMQELEDLKTALESEGSIVIADSIEQGQGSPTRSGRG